MSPEFIRPFPIAEPCQPTTKGRKIGKFTTETPEKKLKNHTTQRKSKTKYKKRIKLRGA